MLLRIWMFLLNRKTDLVLMAIIIGILLGPVFIQPAQGLKCYDCPSCGRKSSYILQQCSEDEKYCVWGQFMRKDDGTKDGYPYRHCASQQEFEKDLQGGFSCDEFKSFSHRTTLRVCYCQENFCNDNYPPPPPTTPTPSGASFFSSQLLLFRILVSVCASWINL